jgi:IS30 family transposase
MIYGLEIVQHKTLTKQTEMKIYFAHPYSYLIIIQIV